MLREEFLEQYILARTSHKKSVEELCNDALKAWNWIHYSTEKKESK